MAKRKRNQTISIRLTPTEKKEIITKAKQAEMTLTDYLIECSRNTEITVTDLSEVCALPEKTDKKRRQKTE